VGKKTSVYLPDELDRAIRASGKSIPDLIRAGLEAGERDRLTLALEQAEKTLRAIRDGYVLTRRE